MSILFMKKKIFVMLMQIIRILIETKDKTKENQEENKNNENEKENKNEEQLKQIKSGLDENLKYLFNFSYENFLNKESENDSKKTVSEYNNNV